MPHNGVDTALARARSERRLAFVPYLTAGYPDSASTLALGLVLSKKGADVLELGVPFSDPLGDGPTIQRSSTLALERGMTVRGALQLAALLTTKDSVPLVMMGYYNPILRYGLDIFCSSAAESGVAALIVPDLPIEESDELRLRCHERNMHLIYLLAPTSTDQRIHSVAEQASGFIYCMAVTGVTGARDDLSDDLGAFLARVRAQTQLPLIVGFGISRPEHIQRLRGQADGAVVASALVDLIDQSHGDTEAVGAYVERMSQACSAS